MAQRKTYRATITANALKKSKGGTPSISVVLGTKYNVVAPTEPDEHTVYGDLWLTPATIARTKKTVEEVFGVSFVNIADFNEPILVGTEVNIVCEDEEFDGKVREKIAFFNKPGSVKKLDITELESVIASVQPLLTQHADIADATAFKSATDAISSAGEDDLPF